MADQPFEYSVEVEGIDALTDAMTKSEKFYASMADSLSKISSVLERSGDSFVENSQRVEEATESASDAEERSEETSTRAFNTKSGFMSKITGFLGQMKGGYLAILGVATGVVAFLVKAMKSFLAWEDLFLKLNTVFWDNKKAIDGVKSAASFMSAQYGMAYEEGMQIGKIVGELKLVEDGTKNAAGKTRSMVLQIASLARATDTSANSVGDMFYHMTRLYGLPHSRLKSIGSAMSVIQQKTAASGEELASYVKSLTGTFMRLQGMSGKSKANMIKDVMQISAVIKEAGGVPEEFVSTFEKMATEGSIEGQKAIAEIARLSGKTQEHIKSLVDSGEMGKVFTTMGTGLQRFNKRLLEVDKNAMEERSGLSFKTIMATRNLMEGGLGKYTKLSQTIAKEQEKGNRQRKVAAALLSEWTKLINGIKESFLKIERVIGKQVVKLLDSIVKNLLPKFRDFLEWVVKKIDWLSSPAGSKWLKGWNKWLQLKVIPYIEKGWDLLKSIMRDVDKFISKGETPGWILGLLATLKVLQFTTKLVFTPIISLFGYVKNIFVSLKNAGNALSNIFRRVYGHLKELKDAILKDLKPWILDIKLWFTEIGIDIQSFFRVIGGKIWSFVSPYLDKIKSAAKSVKSFFKNLASSIGGFFKSAGSGIYVFIKPYIDSFMKVIKPIFGMIKKLSTYKWAKKFFTKDMSELVKSKEVEDIGKAVVEISPVGYAKETVSNVASNVKGNLGTIQTNAKGTTITDKLTGNKQQVIVTKDDDETKNLLKLMNVNISKLVQVIQSGKGGKMKPNLSPV